MQVVLISLIFCVGAFFTSACHTETRGEKADITISQPPAYLWNRLTEAADFPPSYNFPVFMSKGTMYAFHTAGVWESSDGRSWKKSGLEPLRKDAYSTHYVQFRDAIYALGSNRGNYERIEFGSTVRRTVDFRTWETLAEKTDLPGRVFPTVTVFRNRIWLIGGYDGHRFHNDVWSSADGTTWRRAVDNAPWSPRSSSGIAILNDRMYLLGGGVIDGMPDDNPGSKTEIWSSEDGIKWERSEGRMPDGAGGTPIVFDNELWLVGANRDGAFGRSSLVSADLRNWREEPAPWSPRGAVSVWQHNTKLFMTGGKYSVTENGQVLFIYSNDVWVMTKQ